MANPLHLTDDSFETEIGGQNNVVLVDFWAAWCGPCRAIAPIIDELANEYNGKAKIAKVDVDNNPKVAMQYGIRSIPALLIFKDGSVVDTIVGAVPKKLHHRPLKRPAKLMSTSRPTLFSAEEVTQHLQDVPMWRHIGATLVRELPTSDFAAAIGLVNAVALIAEKMDHHPDILVYGWNKVRITVSTHDQGGLTLLDFQLAKKIDAISVNVIQL